jgi:hypothetical protein
MMKLAGERRLFEETLGRARIVEQMLPQELECKQSEGACGAGGAVRAQLDVGR